MPQVLLSEELRERMAQQQASADPAAPATEVLPLEPADPSAVLWPRALQLAALSSGVFFALCLLGGVLTPLLLVALLWTLGAPIVLLGLYCARAPHTRVTANFGARLGLLSGLAIGLAALFADTVAMLLERFVWHMGNAIDAQFSPASPQWQQLLSQFPAADAAPQQLLHWLSVPEFRAGLGLLGFAIFLLLYAGYSMLAGAFAGLLRSRARPV